MSSRWVPVTWGKERFLIPDCQMIAFCNAVNDRSSTYFPFPHRIDGGDWHRKIERSEDPPRVPPAYRPFLLPKPLDATIIDASEPALVGTFADEKTPEYLVTATVGIGSRPGAAGMQPMRGRRRAIRGRRVDSARRRSSSVPRSSTRSDTHVRLTPRRCSYGVDQTDGFGA
jgi:hypothetical protein